MGPLLLITAAGVPLLPGCLLPPRPGCLHQPLGEGKAQLCVIFDVIWVQPQQVQAVKADIKSCLED